MLPEELDENSGEPQGPETADDDAALREDLDENSGEPRVPEIAGVDAMLPKELDENSGEPQGLEIADERSLLSTLREDLDENWDIKAAADYAKMERTRRLKGGDKDTGRGEE